jgi:hypothetical protein
MARGIAPGIAPGEGYPPIYEKAMPLREIRSGVTWGKGGVIRARYGQDAGGVRLMEYADPLELMPAGNPGIVTRQLARAAFLQHRPAP